MSYSTALGRLYRRSPRGIRLGLDRVEAAAEQLGSPQRGLRCVQVAGTNGKGTVAGLVAHAASALGMRTGLFTSPHLHRFAERVRMDGAEAPPDLLGPALTEVLDLADGNPDLDLTFFEVATLAAFLVFARSDVDLAVLEVGLGGRLDATSVARPMVCAITSIGLDHQALLGTTIGEIAVEKAGVARPDVPLLIGRLPRAAVVAVEGIAADVGAPLSMLGREFEVPAELRVPWPGRHQRDNAGLALAVFEVLGGDERRRYREAFLDAAPSMFLPGRFEVIDASPRFILDGAHNTEAVQALVDALDSRSERVEVVVFGVIEGKPADEMLALLRRRCRRVVLAAPPLERARDPREIARDGDEVVADVAEALSRARHLTGGSGTVLVTGSMFTVAEARRVLLDEPADPQVAL
jgi:dihydrofolate synthase/folylpolyglutamate synthase